MAKSRKQKLKVFRTAIGFHDAYVAAPSQKAALEAWGTDTNLFARGTAEQVTDPELIKAPLARPGEVIKILRATEAEQIRALGNAPPKAKRRSAANDDEAEAPRPAKRRKRGPRPSRTALEKAEKALERANERHHDAIARIKAEQEALERKRRQLEQTDREERERLEQRVEETRQSYAAAMAKWAED